MLRFVGQRLLFILLVCVFIVFAVYLGMDMASNSEVTTPDYNVLAYGQAAWRDTQTFFERLLYGRLGDVETQFGRVPITQVVRQAYFNSMGLLLVAVSGAAIVGLAVGSAAALRKQGAVVLGLLTATVIGISVPSFFGALLLQQVVIWHTANFGRTLSVGGFGWDVEHMLLPVLVLAARPVAYLTRSSFISLGHTMEEDFIRSASAKGLRRRRIVGVHALRNIAVPVLTALGVSVRFSLSTLPVVEFFFGWPGMGQQLLQAINNRQTELVVVLAFALGLTFLVVNLLLDVIYRVIDPRLLGEDE